MAQYHRLTLAERYQIKALKKSGASGRKIAKVLGRYPSTICREIHRNSTHGYRAQKAQNKAEERRRHVGPPQKLTASDQDIIARYLRCQWSPEQISGRLALKEISISHETIYRYIYEDYKNGGDLYKSLRRRRKWRRSRKATRNLKNVGKRSYQNWIDKRPSIVEQRIRFGDYERDTLLGKFNGPVLLTIVDRKSRLTKIAKIGKINATLAHQATVKLLKRMEVKTITNDNGPEFSFYRLTERALKAQVYFNHPYSSWQRGTNENTNGLIRQYYPKGTDFTQVSDADIRKIEALLNNRPRKCLGFKTPLEVQKTCIRVLH